MDYIFLVVHEILFVNSDLGNGNNTTTGAVESYRGDILGGGVKEKGSS